MLELNNISKIYKTVGNDVHALHHVNLQFRNSEFVSILGPSGGGKTTLLNIIGGLDQYTDGDLIINGISTKQYKDRDWDAYRNHSVGFVFQSYNLIAHQSVLSNVELALTLSGVSKRERRKRAIDALKAVGLEDQIHKKPNQMSGGQMQRVAIARALVNNPDILLADEPTGALDTETSKQIMDLLKEIAKDKLVIMVTHNPEIAEEYSSRIIRILDGKIVGDSNPYVAKRDVDKKEKTSKVSMSFWTALTLSFKNLLTKKGRTMLTAFAGSIGIIGIAMILAISTGVNNYIDDVQRDTLASFPIQIERESTNMSALVSNLMGVGTQEDVVNSGEERNGVYGNPVMYKMMKTMLSAEVNTNNLEKLKEYFDAHKDELSQYSSAIHYGYNIKLNVYATDPNGEYAKADFQAMMSGVMAGSQMMSGVSSLMGNSGIQVWQELLTDPVTGEISDLIANQYDLVYGHWPKEKNEILLVLNENNEISDITLHSLGLVDQQTMIDATIAAMLGKEDDGWDAYENKVWSYEEICSIPLKMILPTDYYQYDEATKLWVNISDNEALLNSIINRGMTLNVVGIIKPSADATAPFLSSSLCYTNALTKYYMEAVAQSKIVQQQKLNPDTNIVSGLPFNALPEVELGQDEKVTAFLEYVAGLIDGEKAKLYEEILALPNEEFIQTTVDSILGSYADKTAEEIVVDIKQQYANELGYSEELIESMLGGYNKEELLEILEQTIRDMVIARYADDAAKFIAEIQARPSNAELDDLKAMILAEMYKSIAGLSEPQLSFAKKNIDLAFVAQNWVAKTGMNFDSAMATLAAMNPEQFANVFALALQEQAEQVYQQYGETASNSDKNKKVAQALEEYLSNRTSEELAYLYEHHMPDKISDKSYGEVLSMLGVADETKPDFIYIYPKDFEMKDSIAAMIETYNNGVAEEDKIEYTDIAAMLMSSVSSIITAISVVLICFVSISLVVSSIMIGIITYISVLERTKEIGILRAIGASKRDVSRVFNAETMIVGLLAGLTGIVITLLLCIPFSLIARSVTGIQSLTAMLPWYGYLLVFLSVGLTLIAGLFPSRMAAKKDPVEALRSE